MTSLASLACRTQTAFVRACRGRSGTVAAALCNGAASAAPVAASTRLFATPSAGSQLTGLAKENPYKDVVRYEHKNRKWNLQHVDYYSEALAIGFLDAGLVPGDVVLSWLPAHFSESMVIQFACSKAGLVLYQLDPKLATTDTFAAKEALARALTLTKANVLISQEAGDDVNYINLCHSVIPELRIFDFSEGQPFVTPRFPHLRLPIQTGFDQDDKLGFIRLAHMLVSSDNLEFHLRNPETYEPIQIDGSTPFLGELALDDKGVPTGLGKVLTNEEVIKSGTLQTLSSILKREYHEVEGVGVVF